MVVPYKRKIFYIEDFNYYRKKRTVCALTQEEIEKSKNTILQRTIMKEGKIEEFWLWYVDDCFATGSEVRQFSLEKSLIKSLRKQMAESRTL